MLSPVSTALAFDALPAAYRMMGPTSVAGGVQSNWNVRPVRADEFDAWSRLFRGYADDLPQRSERLMPYSPHNPLLANRVVLLPAEPAEYESEEALVASTTATGTVAGSSIAALFPKGSLCLL